MSTGLDSVVESTGTDPSCLGAMQRKKADDSQSLVWPGSVKDMQLFPELHDFVVIWGFLPPRGSPIM
jgi:hypothetical protein